MDYQTAKKYRRMIERAATSLTDGDALEVPEMFPHWEVDMDVEIDSRICYENKLYRVVQTHKTQEGWEPDNTPALFAQVAKPGEIPVWVQPTGAQDAYRIGDKVHYPTAEGSVYECTSDYNIYAPDVFGWAIV